MNKYGYEKYLLDNPFHNYSKVEMNKVIKEINFLYFYNWDLMKMLFYIICGIVFLLMPFLPRDFKD